jgi:hypothetical protein
MRTLLVVALVLALAACIPIGIRASTQYASNPPPAAGR